MIARESRPAVAAKNLEEQRQTSVFILIRTAPGRSIRGMKVEIANNYARCQLRIPAKRKILSLKKRSEY